MKKAAAASMWLYRCIARAFPREFQRLHGQDMFRATEDLIQDTARRAGPGGFAVLILRVLADLILQIFTEHLAELGQDVRYGTRTLAASPGFTATAAIAVGIGIGMCTVLYASIDSLMLEPAPGIADPDSLVALRPDVSFPAYEKIRDEGRFSDLAAYIDTVPLVWGDSKPATRISGQIVSPNYFRTLGVQSLRGRVFAEEETAAGIQPVAVISERLWRERLGSDPGAVGKVVALNGKPVTILGVAQTGFRGVFPIAASAEIWLPSTVNAALLPELSGGTIHDKSRKVFSVVGRVKPEIDVSGAEASADTIVQRFQDEKDDAAGRGRRHQLIPAGRKLPIGDTEMSVAVTISGLLGGMMLWIACSNVGTMLMARSMARRKEVAIRLSLGAARGRLIRQLLTESLMLGLAGGGIGVLFAVSYASVLNTVVKTLPAMSQYRLQLNWPSLLFTFVISLASGTLFGLIPAFQTTRVDLVNGLKPDTSWRFAGYRWLSFRNLLVLQQVAGSSILLLVTGFVVLGMQRLSSVDPGFNAADLYMMSVDPVRDGYDAEGAQNFFRHIRDRLKNSNGIVDAALASHVPLGTMNSRTVAATGSSGLEEANRLLRSIQTEPVGVGFFETIGIPILRGRSFNETDKSAYRIVVNKAMADASWPYQDPIGKDVELQGRRYEVIGVAQNYTPGGLMSTAPPGVFHLISEGDLRRPSANGVTLLVRTAPGVDGLSTIRQYLESREPNLTVFNATSAQAEVDRLFRLTRVSMFIYAGIGLYGLILAAVGLAGVTGYAVVQRTREIGIRVALGATRMDVLRLVTREGVVLVFVGSVLGQAGAFGVTRMLGAWFNAVSRMTQTSSTDPVLLAGAPIMLAVLTVVSCYLPARRSMRIDPSSALREE